MRSLESPGVAAASADRDRLRQALASAWLTAALVVYAILSQALGHIDADVSWFITFAEKYLDGAVPYVDVTDPNPPSAFLSLVPAVVVARALHLAAEPVVATYVFLLAGASIALCGAILRFGPSRSRNDWGMLLNAAVFLFGVAPQVVFGEREQLALLAMAPLLSLLATRAEGGRPPLGLRLLAGALAGLALGLKPHFGLALALPLAALAWREGPSRLLFNTEIFAALAAAAAQFGLLFLYFPAYGAYALPIAVDLYAPGRDSWDNLLLRSLAPFNAVLLLGLIAEARKPGVALPAAGRVCAFASAGFLLTFFIQGKGWTNHAYPGLALALFAWVFLLLERPAAAAQPFAKNLFLPIMAAAPFLFGGIDQILDAEEHPGLTAAAAAVAPPRPKIIVMARQLDFGHPLTRRLGGSWVGRPNALWVASFAAQLLHNAKDPAYRARLEEYRRKDLAGFAEDVRNGRPDLIVVEDKGTREFVAARPESAGVLAAYAHAADVGEIEIWTRKRD